MTGDNRYGDAPLGKSVEEIEQEGGNLINDPRPGEARRDDDLAGVVPAVVNGTTSAVPAVVRPGALVEGGSGPNDGRTREGRDSSEE